MQLIHFEKIQGFYFVIVPPESITFLDAKITTSNLFIYQSLFSKLIVIFLNIVLISFIIKFNILLNFQLCFKIESRKLACSLYFNI